MQKIVETRYNAFRCSKSRFPKQLIMQHINVKHQRTLTDISFGLSTHFNAFSFINTGLLRTNIKREQKIDEYVIMGQT